MAYAVCDSVNFFEWHHGISMNVNSTTSCCRMPVAERKCACRRNISMNHVGALQNENEPFDWPVIAGIKLTREDNIHPL